MEQRADEDVNLIFGAIIDDNLGDEVRVTVIAAGFDNIKQDTNDVRRPSLSSVPSPEPEPAPTPTPVPEPASSSGLFEQQQRPPSYEPRYGPPQRRTPGMFTEPPAKPRFDDDDELDVPDFM